MKLLSRPILCVLFLSFMIEPLNALAQTSKLGNPFDADIISQLKARVLELEQRNKELQAELEKHRNPLSIAAVEDWKLVTFLQGSILFAQNEQRTFLGVLDFTGRDADSIFNETGRHGSEFGLESVWNVVGFYGSEVGLYSALNKLCIRPPLIVKDRKAIGHLTVNTLAVSPARFDPHRLLSLARTIQGKR